MIQDVQMREAIGSDFVKHQTKALHAATEKVLLSRLKHIQYVEDYAAILALFYGFFSPLEEIIQSFIRPSILADIARRRNTDSIKMDLSTIGNSSPLYLCNDLPVITNVLQAFGALYVIEGSTLGGVHIARMIKANPSARVNANAFSFFNAYGNQTETMWNTFKQALNAVANSDAAIMEVATTANLTFEKFKRWIENNK